MEDSTLLLIDTPYTPEATEKLLMWAKTRFHPARYCAIVTHYHIDRMGGISALMERGIPVYGSKETAQLPLIKGILRYGDG
jgi:metallo-beta-lactamase class B